MTNVQMDNYQYYFSSSNKNSKPLHNNCIEFFNVYGSQEIVKFGIQKFAWF